MESKTECCLVDFNTLTYSLKGHGPPLRAMFWWLHCSVRCYTLQYSYSGRPVCGPVQQRGVGERRRREGEGKEKRREELRGGLRGDGSEDGSLKMFVVSC